MQSTIITVSPIIQSGQCWIFFLAMSHIANAYRDEVNANRATLKKFNGQRWVNVGSGGISVGLANCISLDLDQTGQPYVAFTDSAASFRATVMKYDGSKWITVGNAGFSAGTANYTCIAISSAGVPYVAYSDNGNSDRATVMKYDSVDMGIFEHGGRLGLIYPNPGQEQITITTNTSGSLVIHNISGKQVLQQPVTKPTTTIDVRRLPGGVYFVRLTGDKNLSIGTFIKQ